MRRRRPCTSHAQPFGERRTETSEGLSAAVSISVMRTGADEATICREYSPEDDKAADPAAAGVREALSEVDARAEGVPSMDDLLSPPIPLPRILVLSPDPEAVAGVRGVENMFSSIHSRIIFLSKNYSFTLLFWNLDSFCRRLSQLVVQFILNLANRACGGPARL